jgi:DNA helicase HerA-like ATPase
VRAEEKALISLFEEGGRGEPRPPDLPGKRKSLNRGLTLLSFQGDEALVSFPRPPRLGEALLLREGPRKLLLQVVWAKAEERGWIARAKVRGPWDGVLPSWDAEIFPTSPPIPKTPGPKIFLGRTLEGEEFSPGGRALEKVNVIVGAKGSGKSHLAKVILLGLIRAGAPCLVLDVNREYGGLPGVRTYAVGKDFKLGVREIGVEALSVMLEAFGTPATSLLYFETRLSKLFREKKEFIGIDELISMAEEGEFYPTQSGYAADAVNRTLRSRLEALKLTGMVARSSLEASSFAGVWKGIREGGVVAFDLSGLSTPARMGFAQALLRFLFALVEEEEKVPFVFFEEAHLYVTPQGIDALVTRARHTGITSFFITNTPTALPEGVLRAADNLFIFRLPLEEDIKWVAKSGMIEESSLLALVQALPKYACLALGEATEAYPVVLLPDPLAGVDTRGKTRYFFAFFDPTS